VAREVRGARERKAPETFKVEVPEKAEFVIQKGKGKPIGELPDVCAMLEKHKGRDDVLQQMHTVAFGKKGPMAKVKAHLREFSGFPFAADAREAELAKRTAFLGKRSTDELKQLLSVCCLERSGKKEELVARLVDFFDKPAATGIAPAAAKRKRAATPAKGKKPAKASPAKKGKAAAKKPAAAKKKAPAAAKKGKDPAAGVKKPPSVLELYIDARLPSLREKNDGVTDEQLTGHLKDKWKTLPADKKAKFEEEHAELQAKYQEVRCCARAHARALRCLALSARRSSRAASPPPRVLLSAGGGKGKGKGGQACDRRRRRRRRGGGGGEGGGGQGRRRRGGGRRRRGRGREGGRGEGQRSRWRRRGLDCRAVIDSGSLAQCCNLMRMHAKCMHAWPCEHPA
jgi:hypothetical protein